MGNYTISEVFYSFYSFLSFKLHILANPATDSGLNRPPIGAKRPWGFIICPCGRNESNQAALNFIQSHALIP
jgi:hypothetical protein